MIRPGDLLTLVPEKAAAGGRMLARHDGMVILVAGAIPGERVTARADRVEKSLAFATVVEVLEPHPERRAVPFDPRCGGAALAHISPAWQRRLKADAIADALERIGRIRLDGPIHVAPSPEAGYRMRARLRLAAGRLGFLLEGTHEVCDAAPTMQLLPATGAALAGLAERLAAGGLRSGADVVVSENRPADERACHVELTGPAGRGAMRAVTPVSGVSGLTWAVAGSAGGRTAYGSPCVEDVVCGARLRRHVCAFFQGNRFLLDELAGAVVSACPAGDVVDLYAGVGLFGAALAATGMHRVVAVEGHPASARDLRANARPFGEAMRVEETRVERFIRRRPAAGAFTLVLDPPRSGMSPAAAAGAAALGASRAVFVSCDVATFARDVRRFVDAGYRIESIRAFDLFPNTPHVESLAVLAR
ncbi:MAG TPA: RsmD family RNA methyltransferase [Vicinamibacterales bacterium]|nr:RsmD family RNA methyltransferase [Vicinamibacterales bacterium]HPW21937.1 RsmD family RNA methyltransferase [Vicinamibacterales bacterium]